MKIETYEIEEATNEAATMAADSNAQELIAKLGLEGQASLINTDTCTRFPYGKMTKSQYRVFNTLFPQRTKLKSYSDGIIPIRVLQVAAFVKDFDSPPCREIMVWHCGSAKEDPILVGHTNEYGGEFYLLARWGEALMSMEEMIEKAKVAWIARAKIKLDGIISDARSDIASIENLAEECFTRGECLSGENNYDLNNL